MATNDDGNSIQSVISMFVAQQDDYPSRRSHQNRGRAKAGQGTLNESRISSPQSVSRRRGVRS